MLKVFRDNLKYLSWVLWAVILVFVLFVFVDFGTVSGGMGAGSADTVAMVGDHAISSRELRLQYRQLERQYRQQFGDQFNAELAAQLGLQRQALEQLVDREILLDQAEALDLEVGDEEVRQAIFDNPAFQDENGNFVGRERYTEILERNRLQPDAHEESIRERLLLTKITRVLTRSVYVSEAEVEKAYREQAERASIRYLQLPATDLSSEVSLTQRELVGYLQEHPDDFMLPERRSASYLLVDSARLRGQIEIPDATVRAYYDANPDEFTQDDQVQARHILLAVNEERDLEQARAEIERIRQRIEGGEGFAQVAAEVSEDPGSASRGGHLGFFGRGRMTPEFEEAAFGAEVGELTVVETGFGVHLLEVTGRREEGLQPYDEVQARIRNRLQTDEVLEVTERRVEELAARLEAEETEPTGETLQRIAGESEAFQFQRVGPFAREDLVPGIGRSDEFIGAVFGLEPGQLSAPLRVPRGYVLTIVEQIEDPRPARLEDVESEVRQAAEAERRQQLAMGRLGTAAADITEGVTTFDAAAEQLGLTPQESAEFGGDGFISGLGRQPAIADAALAGEVGDVEGPFGTAQGAVIFEVVSRTEFDPERFAAEREATRQRLEAQQGNLLLTSLINQRKLDGRYYRIVPAWQEQLQQAPAPTSEREAG